jgi:hypothetical protein
MEITYFDCIIKEGFSKEVRTSKLGSKRVEQECNRSSGEQKKGGRILGKKETARKVAYNEEESRSEALTMLQSQETGNFILNGKGSYLKILSEKMTFSLLFIEHSSCSVENKSEVDKSEDQIKQKRSF